MREGLREAAAILDELKSGGYALTPDYIEAKSLATVCTIILSEVIREVIEKQDDNKTALPY